MKRIISSLVGICLLVGAVPALAGEPTPYAGPIDDNHKGFVAFDLVKTDGGRFVRNVEFSTFIRCEEESGTIDAEIEGRFRVRHGEWEGTHDTGPTEVGNRGDATFAGKLKAGGKAKGTIKFHDESAEFGTCNSRTRDWVASQDPN